MPQWPPQDSRQALTAYNDRPVHHFSSAPNLNVEPPSFPSVRQWTSTDAPWRGFENPSGWSDHQQPQQHHNQQQQRRSPNYPPLPHPPSPQLKPRAELAEAHPDAPNARRVSSLSIIPNAPPTHEDDYRSAYPTPTFGSYSSRSSCLSSSVPSGVPGGFDESRPAYQGAYHSSYAARQALPSPTESSYSSASDSNPDERPAFNPQFRSSLSGNLDSRSSIEAHAGSPYFPPHAPWDNNQHGRAAEQFHSYHPTVVDGARR